MFVMVHIKHNVEPEAILYFDNREDAITKATTYCIELNLGPINLIEHEIANPQGVQSLHHHVFIARAFKG